MNESKELRAARTQLAQAEARFDSAAGLSHLQEGLAALDEVIENDATERTISRTVAATYAGKIFARIQATIQTDRAVPQPMLEHYFKMLLAFDAGDFELPEQSRAVKIAVVRRLVELLYEGYPQAQREAALKRLSEMTR
jgi:hypothetical protein